MAARWDSARRRPTRAPPRRHRARRRERPSSAPTTARRRASRSPTRRPTRRAPTAASTSSRPSTSPRTWPTCARVGTVVEVAAGPESLRWFGAGPHETYPDRKRGGLVGLWESTVADQYVPYIRPQENGGHADVRWLELRDAAGAGLRIDLDQPRQVSVTHHRAADLAAATHDIDLVAGRRHRDPHRCRASRPRHGELRAGHDPGVPARDGPLHAGPGPCATSRRPDRCRSPGPPDAREFHLRNDHVSYVMRVHEDGSLGHLYFGAALADGRPLAHVEAGRLRGLLEPRRRPGRARIPDDRRRRLPDPGPDRRARRRLDRARPRLRRAPHRPGQARLARTSGLPATYVEADDEADTLDRHRRRRRQRPRRSTCAYTIFRDRPVVARSARIRNDGTTTVRLTGGDERDARPARRPLGVRPAERRVGAREPRRRDAAAARPPVGRQRPRRLEPPAQPVPRPRSARRRPRTSGEVYGFSLVYSGNFIAEAEVDPYDTTRVRIGISPDTFTWTLEPGDAFQTPEAILVYSDAGLGDDERRAPRPVPRAAGARDVARRAAAGPHQQLGGDLLRLRRGQAGRDRDLGARPRRRAVRPRRRLVRPARLGRLVARRLVRRPAQAARTASMASPRRSRRWASSSASGSSPR